MDRHCSGRGAAGRSNSVWSADQRPAAGGITMTVPSTGAAEAAAAVARLGSRYHAVRYTADPIAATADGVSGFDGEMPDPGRDADDRVINQLAGLATELAAVDERELD